MTQPTVQEMEARSALNQVQGMPFRWSLNPYKGCAHGCSYCYARAYHTFLNLPPSAFETALFAKTNVHRLLRAELRRGSWLGEHIAIGTATDPYQPIEGRYRLTRRCLEVMAEFDNPGSITTKGTLVTRDADILSELAAHTDFRVNISLITLDKDLVRKIEPGAPSPQARLRAIELLNSAGVPVSVSLAPVLPGLTDRPAEIEAVVRAAAECGASDVWTGALRLAPGVKEHFFEALSQHFPNLLPGYQRLYGPGSHAPTGYQLKVESLVSSMRHAVVQAASAVSNPPGITSPPAGRAPRGQLALPI